MKTKITILILTMCFTSAFGQVKDPTVLLQDTKGNPKVVKLNESELKADKQNLTTFLRKELNESQSIDYIAKKRPKVDELNLTTQKWQQTYNGIPVEFGRVNSISKNGYVKNIVVNYVEVKNTNTTPGITEENALQFALDYVGANKYAWEVETKEEVLKRVKNDNSATYYPKGELVIINVGEIKNTDEKARLAYKFDIYAYEPISRRNYYVDAQNGEILFEDAILKHVEGPADTRYSGQRNIETDPMNGQFRLRDFVRGNGITTYNNFNQTVHVNNDYFDNDNNWTATEYNNANRDNAGLDAHWGTMMTYDYFFQNHNRNSIDDNGQELISYVNADLSGWGFQNSDNAFWDGSVMTYGMGTSLPPLTTLDITAHEIGHGLDENTSDLIYQNESGALDESLSDIWAACVEQFAAPEKDAYILAEDLGLSLRSMEDPNSRSDPDTYQGNFWFTGSADNGGVHTNSGVMNHWFYLLSEGSDLTDEINDNGDAFSFQGIGIDDAASIVYRAQTNYFHSNTSYAEAREFMILAAEDIFGEGSLEASIACQAWFAVGVGDNNCGFDVEINGDQSICSSSQETYSLNYTPNTVNWSVTNNLQIINITQNSVTVQPSSNFTNGEATISVIADGTSEEITIWIGSPKIKVELQNATGSPELAIFHLLSTEGTLNNQNISLIHWEKLEFNACSFRAYDNHIIGKSQCPGNNWSYPAKVEVTNPCGTFTINFTVSPPPMDPGDCISFDGNSIIIPCINGVSAIIDDQPYINQVVVYNLFGQVVATSQSNKLNINHLSNGVYIFYITLSDGKKITKKIIK